MKYIITITCVLDGLAHYYGSYDCHVGEENRAEIERQIREKYPDYTEVLVYMQHRRVDDRFSYKALTW